MMIYTTVLAYIVAIVLCVGVLRMLAQGFFMKRKVGKGFFDGCIPGLSGWKFHKMFSKDREFLIGSAMRIVGFVLMIVTLLWQYYESMVQMTHMYGLIFQNYEPTNYHTLWNVMSFSGILLIVAGMVVRMITYKRISFFFGQTGLINFLGMIEPAFYYIMMGLNKKAIFLLNKPTKQMTREEYQMYCALTED